MEAMGAVYFDEEWESVSKIFSSHENADFMLPLQNENEFLNNHLQENGGLDILTGDGFFSSGSNSVMINTNIPQSHQHKDVMMTTFENDNPLHVPTFYPDDAYKIMRADTCEGNLTAIVDSHKELQQLKRNIETVEEGQTINSSFQNPTKKPRVSRHKNKKTALPKPNKSPGNGDEDPEENARTSSCTSSNHTDHELTKASNEVKIEMQNTNSKAKTRATRGAATDPQSLYARRRRERINERLRILQNLIPNGTKVDISTMLEQAVHYVKFLQLQIKLLSSDDLWMYAPIAYNGMDIELFQKTMPTL